MAQQLAVPNPFVWDKSFCVGHEATNTEHKNLFTKIDHLAKNQKSAEALKDLLDYVGLHFKNEEARMKEANFKEFDSHCEVHKKFVQDCLAVKEINDGIIDFLKNWLVKHIKVSDMKYKGVLKN